MSQDIASALLAILRANQTEINGVSMDSRKLQSGELFLAYPGAQTDGRQYIPDAIVRGAAAILWERAGFDWDPTLSIPNVPVDGLANLAGFIASEVYGHPSQDLWLTGVTGTNGKTSITQWLARAFNELGRKCGVIGTLGIGFPGQLTPSHNTTPDAVSLQRMLAQFREQGAQAATLEVSSIGLHQGRVNGCRVDIAILTNLTRDHLDYHGSMEAYAHAKNLLFDLPDLHSVILNFDDLFGVAQARRLQSRSLEVVGYTLVPSNANVAPATRVLVADGLRTNEGGMRFVVHCDGKQIPLRVNLVGQFNVSNLLAVVAALVQSGYSLEEAAAAATTLTPPTGRMQTIGGVGEPLVVVDYAHTPDALEQALLALRDTVQARRGKLICIFGCGGGRDKGKRPMMGEVASRLADQVVLTSDNPRAEDPQKILDDIAAGADTDAIKIIDRADAIEESIGHAEANDVVLIAGKGHEPYQEVGATRLPFSDIEQARRALAAWNRTQEELL